MRKVAYIISKDCGVEYFVKAGHEINNTNVKLVRSKYGTWTKPFKGKTAAKLHSDGNGVDVQLGKEIKFRFNYSEVCELLYLLREYQKISPNLDAGTVRLPLAVKE